LVIILYVGGQVNQGYMLHKDSIRIYILTISILALYVNIFWRWSQLATRTCRQSPPIQPAHTDSHMSSQYTRLPTNEDEEPPVRQPSYEDDPRFRAPKVAAWKRVALVAFVIFLFYLGYWLRRMAITENNEDIIVHAER